MLYIINELQAQNLISSSSKLVLNNGTRLLVINDGGNMFDVMLYAQSTERSD